MDRKETTKNKTSANKKSNNIMNNENLEFETLMKKQQDIVEQLKIELKNLHNVVQANECIAIEKDNCIQELEQSVNQRDVEIHKLTTDLEELEADNNQILFEFNTFKEKFYQLEIDYARNFTLQKEENDKLMEIIKTQESMENQKIQELNLNCEELQQRLQITLNDLETVNKIHKENLENFEQLQKDFDNQVKEFEVFKQEAKEVKEMQQETYELDLQKLKEDLVKKESELQQCLMEKNVIEKEKNLVIDELNNKICRIERAFSQPTKVVPPMVSIPQSEDNMDNNSSSETSNDNLTVSKPQTRKPLENVNLNSLKNNENQKPEQNPIQRNYKFKRPVPPPATSSQLTDIPPTNNNNTNKKRRQAAIKQPTVIKYNEFSSMSSDEEDKESDYNSFTQQLWRPNTECYVADTDASEGFAKVKRSRK